MGDDIRWSYLINKVCYSGKSEFQEIDLVETGAFGKVLLLDGKMQSSELDEQVYHELLVHPALLHHADPRTVFICGGGEGATAREVLRHKTVEKVVMVDIDKVVCDACCEYLPKNTAAFKDPRLTLIHDDARTQLENWPGKFDVIISDLADPLDGGPCYQLYTQEFYRNVVRNKLNAGGIFIAQCGPAGFRSCKEVFTTIHHTLASVFPSVHPYVQHMPSYCDCWGYNLALTDPSQPLLAAEEFDARAAARISGELEFVDGCTFLGLTQLNKMLRKALAEETEIYTMDNPKFIHGGGVADDGATAACAAAPPTKLVAGCSANLMSSTGGLGVGLKANGVHA